MLPRKIITQKLVEAKLIKVLMTYNTSLDNKLYCRRISEIQNIFFISVDAKIIR